MPHTVVLVLGDVGRSPRMCFHALSLANQLSHEVSLVGYRGEACLPELEENPNVRKFLISPVKRGWFARKFFLLFVLFKVLLQIFQLLWLLLFKVPKPDFILVQNPPSIPSLPVAWFVALCRRSRLIIDWHNFGYTILGLSLGQRHPLVRLSLVFERFFGRKGAAHFCVTRAMQKWLRTNWGIRARVLYDRPPEFFKRTSVVDKHELFSRLRWEFSHVMQRIPDPTGYDYASIRKDGELVGGEATLMTTCSPEEAVSEGSVTCGGWNYALRKDRPVMIVSSTSWTPDEDFRVFFDALVELDARTSADPRCPHVLVVVTGKGPQKQLYEDRIAKLALRTVHICTMWLKAEDYPVLLGCADVGVSLHTSSSGLDLPMKVVDMFGCNLPVCAVNFQSLHELVVHGKNGLVFEDSNELADQLWRLIHRFPSDQSELQQLSRGVKEFLQDNDWESNWKSVAAPVFTVARSHVKNQ